MTSQAVPAGRIVLNPHRLGKTRSSSLMENGYWTKQTGPAEKEAIASYRAELPPELSTMTVESVTIEFKADNRGQNLQFDISLQDQNGKVYAKQNQDGDVYRFTDLKATPGKATESTFYVRLHVKPIQTGYNSTASDKHNSWKVHTLNILATGTLPDHATCMF